MSEAMGQILVWIDYLREHPTMAAVAVVVLGGFYYVSTWKPKHTRDAESRLREIREETHDFYRHMRPPGR
jgi:hypothetical protein